MVYINSLLAGTLSTDFTGSIAGMPTHYVILGIILVIVSIVVYSVKRAIRRGVRRKAFDTVTQKTTSDKQQPPKSCPDCGQSLRYVEEYDKWYCDNCQEYK